MRYWGSVSHIVDLACRYTRAKIAAHGIDDGTSTRIDRQRRIVGLVLFVVFIGLPALFLLLLIYFPKALSHLF